jgi:hypothetical protein
LRKILVWLLLAFILSGCAIYRFQRPVDSGAQGYLVSYDGKTILEYTVGKEKSLPDLALAKERFKRRRSKVEYYYKQMDQIEGRLKEFLWDPPVMLVDFFWSVLRWPFIAAADYKYNHNPEYRAKVDRLDQEKEVLEKTRISSLKEELNAYIVEDLTKESSTQTVAPVPSVVSKPVPEVLPAAQKVEAASAVLETPLAAKSAVEPSAIMIIAKPPKGHSPLKVNFSYRHLPPNSAKIVSYNWDFGDGDTSAKKNPQNTYWSTTYGTRNFTVTLTVKDEAGSTFTSTCVIEVATR